MQTTEGVSMYACVCKHTRTHTHTHVHTHTHTHTHTQHAHTHVHTHTYTHTQHTHTHTHTHTHNERRDIGYSPRRGKKCAETKPKMSRRKLFMHSVRMMKTKNLTRNTGKQCWRTMS